MLFIEGHRNVGDSKFFLHISDFHSLFLWLFHDLWFHFDLFHDCFFVTNCWSRSGLFGSETEAYKSVLTAVNRYLVQNCDAAFEVVCGIPVKIKGELPCLKV